MNETLNCPNCKTELVNVYLVGWAHPAYLNNDCHDGLTHATKKAEDGTEINWFEVKDVELRNFFLKKIAEIEKISIDPVQKTSEKPNKAESESFFKQIDKIMEEAPKEPTKQSKKREFLGRFKPYYDT